MIAAVFDRGRHETWFFTALAILLVFVRAAVFIFHGYIDFDSDQAIVGLMAKHLSEFRTFPLFFYDQNYMLGVQAWIIAPFFWIARPSIAVLKTPLVLLYALAAVLLMRGISTNLRLRPAIGFVAALPFIVPTPPVAGSLLQTLGASGVEPILYVLFLWMLRGWPLAFGALLAVGFLHREFTMYALPALVVIHAADRSLWSPTAPRWAMRMAGAFGLVWLIIDDAKMHLDGHSLALQAQMLGKDACFEAGEYLARIRYMFRVGLPVLSGGRTMVLSEYATRSSAVVGSPVIAWIAGGAMVLILARIAWLLIRRRVGAGADIGFGVYLALVGCCALAAYPLACSANTGIYPIIRYMNMGLLVPVGCFAVFMALETSARLRSAVVIAFVVWGSANLVDNVKEIRAASVQPLPDPHRELTDFLLSHQIRYARADYWDAYVVDFLSRERVIVGSNGPARIPEYERRVDENSHAAVNIERMPCQGQQQVAAWCVQLPPDRPGEGAH
jgi:hypothetical protein